MKLPSGPVVSIALPGVGALLGDAVGQAVLTDELRARRCSWPPLRFARVCREHVVRHEASMIEWNERSNGGPSQRVVEAGGSLVLGAQGAGGSSPDNDGTGRHRQTAWARQARREGVARANQWSNPLKRGIGSNLADVGRGAAHAAPGGVATPWPVFRGWRGGHGEGLRRTRGEAAGGKLGAAPVDRSAVNVGTIPGPPAVGGQARCRLLAPGWGGAFVVVRGRESRPHGEGRQRTCSVRLEGGEVGVE
jgi:hypothetical protein